MAEHKVIYSLQQPKNELSKDQLQGEKFTDQFKKNYRILKFSEYDFGGRKQSMTYAFKYDNSYEDNKAIYSLTCYMTDAELATINEDRAAQKLPPLPRLAYTGDCVYVACSSQRERKEIESLVERPDISKLDFGSGIVNIKTGATVGKVMEAVDVPF